MKRALILNGIILVAVLAAVVFSSNGGPGTVTFRARSVAVRRHGARLDGTRPRSRAGDPHRVA